MLLQTPIFINKIFSTRGACIVILLSIIKFPLFSVWLWNKCFSLSLFLYLHYRQCVLNIFHIISVHRMFCVLPQVFWMFISVYNENLSGSVECLNFSFHQTLTIYKKIIVIERWHVYLCDVLSKSSLLEFIILFSVCILVGGTTTVHQF